MNTVKQLVQAASKSDLKTLNHILKAEPDLAQDWKPLMDACYSGRAEVVDVLLKHGADPNIKSKSAHNYRPLHRTVEFKKTAPKTEGHLKTVELLLKHGADPMMPGAWYKVSAIAVAAFGGTKQFLPPMLKRAPRQLDLYTATALGRVARIKAILGKNPSLARAPDREPSEKDKGLTALHYCASSSLGQKDAKVAAALAEVAELLIENGADPQGCVDRACWSSNTAVLKALLENGGRVQDDDTLNHAACDGLTEPLDLLAEYGIPLDGTNGTGHHGGYTPLGCAVSCRSLRGAKWFIDKGQDPNRIKSKIGETSLHVAVNWKASDKMLELLLESGTKLNAKDENGRTALALAREKGHQKAIAFLEKAGANG